MFQKVPLSLWPCVLLMNVQTLSDLFNAPGSLFDQFHTLCCQCLLCLPVARPSTSTAVSCGCVIVASNTFCQHNLMAASEALDPALQDTSQSARQPLAVVLYASVIRAPVDYSLGCYLAAAL